MSTPTINDDVPALVGTAAASGPSSISSAGEAGPVAAARGQLPVPARAPKTKPASPARATPRTAAPVTSPPPPPAASVARRATDAGDPGRSQGLRAEHATRTQVYSQQAVRSDSTRANARRRRCFRQRAPVPVPPVMPSPAPVTITISPLDWRTLPFDGKPTLVAVRQVQTPDGTFAQGFVVDRLDADELARVKGGRDGRRAASGDGIDGAEVVPGWRLTVAATAATAGAGRPARPRLIARDVPGPLLRDRHRSRWSPPPSSCCSSSRRDSSRASAASSRRPPRTSCARRWPASSCTATCSPTVSAIRGRCRDYARRMSEEAARLGRVVSNVLGFSQLERGNLSVEAQVGPLGDALREVAEPRATRARSSRCDTRSRRRVGAARRFDRDALARIVGNLSTTPRSTPATPPTARSGCPRARTAPSSKWPSRITVPASRTRRRCSAVFAWHERERQSRRTRAGAGVVAGAGAGDGRRFAV